MYKVTDVHPAIVDRHIFEQAQKILEMRRVGDGNSTYPYGEMLRCPHCGKTLVHGSLNNFSFKGSRIQNGGWGCYGEGGCREFLIIQTVLDEALIKAYAGKYGEEKDKVEFYWLDDYIEKIELDEEKVLVYWRDGDIGAKRLDFYHEDFKPGAYARFYNGYLSRIVNGMTKTKYRNLMGLEGVDKDEIPLSRKRIKTGTRQRNATRARRKKPSPPTKSAPPA